MNGNSVRFGVGTKLAYDGAVLTVEEVVPTVSGLEVLAKDGRGKWHRISVRELLISGGARVISREPGEASSEQLETMAVRLSQLHPRVDSTCSPRASIDSS